MRKRHTIEPKPLPEGVEPPEKKGLLRVMELLDRDGTKYFKAGLWALLGLIPFALAVLLTITSGGLILLLLCVPAGMLAMPQLTAAADTVMRSMRNEVGWWWWDTYKDVWKRNFRASLLPGALGGLLVGLQIVCFYFLTQVENPGADFWLVLAATVVSTALTQFYLPMLVCMDLPFGALMRNCFVLLLSHPIRALLAAAVQVAYWGAILVWFPLTLVILSMTSVWLPMLLAYSILYPALDKHMDLTAVYKKIQKEHWE